MHAEEQIHREDSQLLYWKQFRGKGQHDNEKTIQLLEHELVDMEASFTEISSTAVFCHNLRMLAVARRSADLD